MAFGERDDGRGISSARRPSALLRALRSGVRSLAARALAGEEREVILGDLEELHGMWLARHGGPIATMRYIHALLASVWARALGRVRARAGGRHQAFRRWSSGGNPFADLRQTARSLRRRPGFVIVAAVTLGAGIGSAGAVFSVMNQLLLRPPPGVVDADGAAYLEFRTEERRGVGVSGPAAQTMWQSASLLDGFATYDYIPVHVSTGDGAPVEARGYTIYGEYFEVLGVRPSAGRLLAPEETGPDADPSLAVISERLAQRLFGEADRAVGRPLQVNGQGLTVLGVAGGGFTGTDRSWQVDLWVPRSAFVTLAGRRPERLWADDSRLNQDFVIRPRPGVSFEAAEAQVNAILDGLAETGVGTAPGTTAVVHPGVNVTFRMRPRVNAALGVLSLAGVLILIIPCANVANLLVIRALNARGQVAIRRALGASRSRIAGRALLESLLLAILGTVAGVGVAFVIGTTVQNQSLWGLPGLEGFTLDGRVIAFGVAAMVMTALVSGTLPAVVATRFGPAAALTDAGVQTTSRQQVIRHGISTLQIALSLTLLVGSGLLARTVANIYAVDSGLDLSGVHIASINDQRVEPLVDRADLEVLRSELVGSLERLDGVRGAALHSYYGPYENDLWSMIVTPDQTADEAQRVGSHWVTPGWFHLFGVEPLVGRVFEASDEAGMVPPPIILTAPLAEALFGTTNVVGRTVRRGIRELEEAVVVGVVGELRMVDPRSPPDEAYFMPYPGGQPSPITVLVALESDRPEVVARAHAELEQTFPGLPVPQPTPLTDRIDRQLAEQRLLARLLVLFSFMAVLLSAVGLYGVMAFAVQGRKRELGIRLALGATGARIAGLVFRSAGAITMGGIALGLLGAYALSRLLESRLFGVSALDPASYLGAAALLALVVLLAGSFPARAAVQVDVSGTLRQE